MRLLVLSLLLLLAADAHAQVWGDPVDVSADFRKLEQVYFMGSRLGSFDAPSGRGTLIWDRHRLQPGMNFNKVDLSFSRADSDEFPTTEYDRDPELPWAIDFLSPRAVRIRLSARDIPIEDEPSLMLDGPVSSDPNWSVEDDGETVIYRSEAGAVHINRDPWRVEFRDKEGRLLTRTRGMGEPATYARATPTSFVRRAIDMGRSMAAAFELKHDEKFFGTGESFTRFNKRGQKVNLFTRDAMGAQTPLMYKPIPFFLSSNGYGMFVHTSAPVTIDFGRDFDETGVIYSGDEMMDLFVFFGSPKQVLAEYTAVTGRSPMPPLWSFGLWMSRITYKSEQEVRQVAQQLRAYKVPADVIHLDTGWFETDWQSNYEFSTSRFDDPAGMIQDLRDQGFRVSLWQLPYYTRDNSVYPEVVEGGFHVRNEGGRLPELDATLDFSNQGAIDWYRRKVGRLLELGVSVIKADFGEGAPLRGLYASGRTGWYEHNLYPLRYNKVVHDLTREVTGDGIIWGRSAWAGSQRYPVHWGGDAENTNSAMAATLRAGLSMGLSGFTFWSHDIGGFVQRAPRDLYSRWLPFGALTSHTRTHGAPPREPWEYDEAMVDEFQRAIGLKYALMPYILAQAKRASDRGLPMMRALLIEYPDDPTSWLIDDQYLFGEDLLVAPLFDESRERDVYLPPGEWIDYQSGEEYDGARWHRIEAGEIPIVLLVAAGSVIPHVAVAQNTDAIDWTEMDLRVYGEGAGAGWVAWPESDAISVYASSTGQIEVGPLPTEVNWTVTRVSGRP